MFIKKSGYGHSKRISKIAKTKNRLSPKETEWKRRF
jgi:hypothetical protein